jgi:anti-anti-sigma factor
MKRLHIRSRVIDGMLRVVTVAGSLDLEATERLRSRLYGYQEKKRTHLVLDFSKVDLLSSSAASLLYEYRAYMIERGLKFGILSPSQAARMVIDLIGGNRVFQIRDNLPDLVSVLRVKPVKKARPASRK